MLNADQLRRLARARKGRMPKYAEAFAAAAKKHFPKYGITSPRAVAAAWANFAQETGGFRIVRENMNYSAKRMMEVWPSRYKTLKSAQRFANNPEALANHTYKRKSLENTQPGDGFKFIGRGPLQTTGRVNYRRAAEVTGLPLVEQPELVEDPDVGMMAACIFWQQMKLTPIAEAGDIKRVRKIVNGGYHGLAGVTDYYNRALQMIEREGFGGDKPVSSKKRVTLRRKDKGADVAALIEKLHERGFYDGPLDDEFGGGTEAAVMHFQEDAGLLVDGIAGPKTRTALVSWPSKATTRKAMGRTGFVYKNQWATRNLPIEVSLEDDVSLGVLICFGPGCRTECYSGGQPRRGTSRKRTGSIRHDIRPPTRRGRAGDFHIFRPDGSQITNLELGKLGQWWLASKKGSVGLEMSGGGIHLDNWVKPPSGGLNYWTYKASDAKSYGQALRSMMSAGKAGRMPELYKAPPKPPEPLPVAVKAVIDDADKTGLNSSTNGAVGVGGIATTVLAAKPVIDAVNETKDGVSSLLEAGPWVLLAIVLIAGAGFYILRERKRKAKLAQAAKASLS